MSGTTFTVSAVLDSLGGISPILEPFSFGMSFTTGTNLTTTHRYTYLFTEQRDTTQETEEALKIPAAIGFGIAYRPGDRVLLAADVVTQAWSTSTFKGKPATGLRNSTMFGIGFERTPARETGQPLLDRLAYRLGAVYHQTYVAPNGDPINAWAVTAGLGIPVSADTRLNLAIEYGSRGTTEKSMIRDNIIRFSASLTISELWFHRFEED
jgi:long-subunit fatty acid transport protein